MKIIKNKKLIYLAGFNINQIKILKKKFKYTKFVYEKKITNKFNSCDAIVGITRASIENVLTKINLKNSKIIKWIHLPGAGVEKYTYLKNFNNITFTNGKIIQGIQVADHAMGLLLTLTRNINLILKYGQKTKFKMRPIELENKKALIVGYGGVGKCLAKRAFGFGMNIKVVNNGRTKYANFVKKFFLSNQLHLASKNIDVIFITMPLTQISKKIVNEKIIKKLNNGAIVINVSRGGCLCLKSLEKYLNNGHLRGAGLDVTDPEPLPKNHSLFKLKNVVITPHIAGISDKYAERNFQLINENIKRYIKNIKLTNTVNFKRGY